MLQEGEEQFDLVMADSNMNEMDVFDFLDCVVNERDIPIIITSMDESMEMARRALCGGASFFLHKPIGKRDIVNLWQHVLAKRIFHEKLVKQRAVDTNQETIVKVVDPGLCRISTSSNNNNQLLQVEVADVDGGMLLSMESQDIYKEQMIISKQKGKELEESKRNIQGIETMLEGDSYGGTDNEIPPTNTSSHVRRSIEMEKQVKSSNIITNGKSTSKFGIDKKGSKSKNRLDTVGSTTGRSCIKWTPALRRKFIEAVNALGEKKVTAKAIHRKMNDYNLTVRQIASHLQKYREGIKPAAAFSSVPVVQPAMTRTADSIRGYGGSYPSVPPEQHDSMVHTQEGGVNIIPNPEAGAQFLIPNSISNLPTPGLSIINNNSTSIHEYNMESATIAENSQHSWPSNEEKHYNVGVDGDQAMNNKDDELINRLSSGDGEMDGLLHRDFDESIQNVSLGSTELASNVWTDMVDELFVDDVQ